MTLTFSLLAERLTNVLVFCYPDMSVDEAHRRSVETVATLMHVTANSDNQVHSCKQALDFWVNKHLDAVVL